MILGNKGGKVFKEGYYLRKCGTQFTSGKRYTYLEQIYARKKNNIPRYLILSNSGVVPLTIAACNTSKRRRRKEKTCSISGLFSLLLKVHSSSTQVLMSGIQSTFDTKK